MDRMSQLPQHLLHEILCFLSQKEAVQTSVLSKSWRYLGSTRPNLDFHDRLFRGDKETLQSVVDKTLQRYHDQKLPIQEFRLTVSGVDSESIPFLEKWIPIVILNLGVKTFNLSFLCVCHDESAFFNLPHVFFESETLQSLSLYGCKLNRTPVILCKHLKKLFFDRVYIADETLVVILSSCRLIESLVIHRCKGLKNITLDDRISLKLFDFENYELLRNDDDHSIEINSPTVETINIVGFPSWFNHHKYLFPHLKSLYLENMRLSSSSFDNFSSNFPCLEELSLITCYGFDEFQLSSSSIKNFIIEYWGDIHLKVVIDAPRLVGFQYNGHVVPRYMSFQATASEWKSEITVLCDMTIDGTDASLWCLALYEMLMALSKSKISLHLIQEEEEEEEQAPEEEQDGDDDDGDGDDEEEEEQIEGEVYILGGLCEPVVVERLVLRLDENLDDPSSGFLKSLKRICIERSPASEEET
ncbi:hypothetical protein CASFOL_013030 [Castilleja foliolosa]|uniref:F-box domain-containing protein n=1 Tax=Castilleja foliolosa TaxID=1961234 RepID=A0ABD3DIT1_9LAMI